MFCACGSGLDGSAEIGGVRVSRNSDNLVQDGIERTLTQIASGRGLTSSGTATKMLVAVVREGHEVRRARRPEIGVFRAKFAYFSVLR